MDTLAVEACRAIIDAIYDDPSMNKHTSQKMDDAIDLCRKAVEEADGHDIPLGE